MDGLLVLVHDAALCLSVAYVYLLGTQVIVMIIVELD
jgi:hypothetical protein